MRSDNVLRAFARGCTAVALLAVAGTANAQINEDWSSGTENGWTVSNENFTVNNWTFDGFLGEWFAADVPETEAQYLTSPSFALGSELGLEVEHWFDMEDNFDGTAAFDGGVVEVSVNGGAFTYLPASAILTGDTYLGPVSACCQNPLAGLNAFSGPSSAGAGFFVTSTFDLSGFASTGDMVQVRFVLGTDSSLGANGWAITRVTSVVAMVPTGACCMVDGTCADGMTEAGCDSAGGIFNEGLTCLDVFCQDLTGQCCFLDGTCIETTEEDCTAQGGAFGGLGTDCSLVCEDLAPANNDCSTALPIACGGSATGSTVFATPETLGDCVTGDGTGGAVWYSFMGNGDFVTATTCNPGTNFDTKLRVFEGVCGGLVCVTGNDDGSPTGGTDPACFSTGGTANRASTVNFSTEPGVTYYILVHGFGSATGDFELTVSCASGAANDLCENAEIVNIDSPVSGSTQFATGTDVASCGADEHDVWYAFLPSPSTSYMVSTTGATTNLSIAVFNENCPDLGGTELACGDPSGNDGVTIFTSDAIGSAVFIRVATDETSSGSPFNLTVTEAPAGFVCEDPITITSLPYTDANNNVLAGDDGPPGSCNSASAMTLSNSMWYTFTPSHTMDVEIDLDPLNFDGLTALFEGACNSLVEVACADEPEPHSIIATLTGGQTYFLAVGDWLSPGGGDYLLNITELTGACIGTDGQCRQMTSPNCAASGGSFVGGDCATGACCLGGDCVTTTGGDCVDQGGSYQGDGIACFPGSSPNTAIPDNSPAGFSDSITLSDSEVITTIEVDVDMTHTWMGDVILTLQGPNGVAIDLVNRAGVVGGVCCGHQGTLDGVYRFTDSALETFDTAGVGLVDGQLLAPGEYLPATVEGAVTSLTSAFAGADAAGNWTLTVSDNAGLDTGTLRSWQLYINGGIGGACDAAPTCACETDGNDAQVDVFDLLAYLDNWFANNAAADIDGTPGVDVFDLLAFLDCWFPASAGNPC